MKNYNEIIERQKELCKKYDIEWYASPPDIKIGISKNINDGTMPINGLRHPPENGTAGWYVWAGEYADDPNFFDPLHIEHLQEKFPMILKYLGLPPGWRFQIDDKGYEDIWFDEKLLELKK